MSRGPVIVIGGGFTGLAAAHELSLRGVPVVLLEAEESLGGLAGSFELQPGIWVEKFYHHWFTSDTSVLDLASEVGAGTEIQHFSSRTGLYHANSCYRLASPLDLLRFHPIPLIDRVRTGLMALRARRIREWKKLEHQTAEEWLIRYGGRKAYEVMWQPLLRGKFGDEAPNVSAVWLWNKLKLRGGSRDTKGAEQLVYLKGGFARLVSAIEESLRARGAQVLRGVRAERVLVLSGRASAVRTSAGDFEAGGIIYTAPLPLFPEMVPDLPKLYAEQCGKIRFLGNVCLVLRLKRSLSETYWLNVADPSFPFVGVIEHTNLDRPENYGGERIAYLSKYLHPRERLFKCSDDEFFEYSLPYVQRIFPEFSREWVMGYKAWRAHYSQPVVSKNYSGLIPDFQTPIENLWLCTMAQVYPEDRGTNYAVKYGRQVARMVAK